MKTFKVTKAKTQTFKPTNIKSLTEFNGAIAAGVNGKVLTKLPVESIEVRPQVRTVIENIDELAESMKSGQLMPITVIKGENNKYVVLQGERRWLAAKKAGLETVEAIVVDAPVSDSERIFGQLTENIQRDNMKLQDLIQSISQLIQNGFNQTEIAARLGKDRTYISRIAALASSKKEVLKLIVDCAVNDAQTAQILNNICEKSTNIAKDLEACEDKDGLISRGSAQAVLDRLQKIVPQKPKKVVAFEDRLKKKDFPRGYRRVPAGKALGIQVEFLDEAGEKVSGNLLPRLLSDRHDEVCVLCEDNKTVVAVPVDKIRIRMIDELA